MNRRHSFFVASSLAMGCALAALPALVGAQQCSHHSNAEYYVAIGKKADGTLDVPDVEVSGPARIVCWEFNKDTAGFRFPASPVTWKPASADNDNARMPANEFAGCGRVSPTLYRCPDKNSTAGSRRRYQYGITVIDPAGRDVKVDPWVINK